jgi:hypothetical protein
MKTTAVEWKAREGGPRAFKYTPTEANRLILPTRCLVGPGWRRRVSRWRVGDDGGTGGWLPVGPACRLLREGIIGGANATGTRGWSRLLFVSRAGWSETDASRDLDVLYLCGVCEHTDACRLFIRITRYIKDTHNTRAFISMNIRVQTLP